MLKGTSKKKRSREEMEEVKNVEEQLSFNKQEFLRKHKELLKANDKLNEEIELHRHNEKILNDLHMNGVIDELGQPLMK